MPKLSSHYEIFSIVSLVREFDLIRCRANSRSSFLYMRGVKNLLSLLGHGYKLDDRTCSRGCLAISPLVTA